VDPAYITNDMKTPREFAERYMDRESYLPFMTNMSGLLYLPDTPEMSALEKIYRKSQRQRTPKLKRIRLNSLEKDSIGEDTKEKIYRALYELTQTMIVDIDTLKKLNRDFIKKRRDAIGQLEKSLRDPLPEKKQLIAAELERLKAFEKNMKPYKEIDFISSWHHIYYAGILKKLVLKIEAKKISDMLSIPMRFKKERLVQFFSAALQLVVSRYLHEYTNIPQEKAERLTMEIVNEYIEKKGVLES
jgi:hypothetical protein